MKGGGLPLATSNNSHTRRGGGVIPVMTWNCLEGSGGSHLSEKGDAGFSADITGLPPGVRHKPSIWLDKLGNSNH